MYEEDCKTINNLLRQTTSYGRVTGVTCILDYPLGHIATIVGS